MLDRAFKVGSSWQLYGLAGFADITFPALSDRQKQITRFALKWVGYPYIWAGEYPTPNSPYGTQKAGGFDCSGFVFYVMKMHFGYPITVNERGAHDMAARAKPRVTREQAQVRRPHLLRAQGSQVERRVDLPRRAVPGQGLVHPLDRLQRRRDPGVAQRLQLLEGGVRVGPSRAHGRGARDPGSVAVAFAVRVGGARRRAACGWPGDADAGGARGVAHRHGDRRPSRRLRRSPDRSRRGRPRAFLSPPTVALPLLSAATLHCAA